MIHRAVYINILNSIGLTRKPKPARACQNHDMVGDGWSVYERLSTDDKHLFDTALQGFGEVIYSPNTCSRKYLNGTNYRFRCTAKMSPFKVSLEAIVEIYESLDGESHITNITGITGI